MKKRAITFIIVLVLLASFSVSAFADYSEGKLYYTLSNGSITITGCFGHDEELVIPSSIAGYPVNTIAKGAFVGHTDLKRVYLPDTIMVVEEGAFGSGIEVIYNSAPSSGTPTPTPTTVPVVSPSAEPTVTPSTAPSATPTATPSTVPTVTPTATPSTAPTVTPTATPSTAPTVTPTATPSTLPTVTPTIYPVVTLQPTVSPTAENGEDEAAWAEEYELDDKQTIPEAELPSSDSSASPAPAIATAPASTKEVKTSKGGNTLSIILGGAAVACVAAAVILNKKKKSE